MKKSNIFPIVVLILSALTIIEFLLTFNNYLALINSFIGLTGVVLYFYKNDKYRKFINAWIYLQFLLITKITLDQESPIIDFTQFFKLNFGFGLTFDETTYRLDFNFLLLIYLIAFKRLQTKSLIGEKLNLKLYRDNQILNDFLPQVVDVLDVIDFPKNKNWLLVGLTSTLDFEGGQYNFALIKSKEDLPIIKKGKRQMSHFRLVDDKNTVDKGESNLDNYPFIDWVFVE